MKNKHSSTQYTLLQRVKCVALGREAEILRNVGGIDAELLDGRHHPCPKCGGHDRFRLIDATTGGVFCNQCFREKNRDYIDAVRWMQDCTFSEAVQMIGEYLGVRSSGFYPASAVKTNDHCDPKAGSRSPKGTAQKSVPKPKSKLLRTIPYEYVNGAGDYHVLIERLEFADGTKTFRQLRWDNEQGRYVAGAKGVTAVPFDAPSFKEASTIYWCEGEKKTVALSEVMAQHRPEICCSCRWGGSNNFPSELVAWFRDKDVVIFSDNDEAGAKYAQRVATAITGTAKSIRIVSFKDFAAKYDIADWLLDGEEVPA